MKSTFYDETSMQLNAVEIYIIYVYFYFLNETNAFFNTS